jgi:DNA polymerase-1
VGDVDSPVVLAVDGNSLVHRSYHAQPDSEHPDWAVRGLLTQLVAAVDRVRPACVLVGFDDPSSSQRRQRWPQYKANRPEKLASLVDQLAAAADAMCALGVAVVVPDGLEADDVLASAARFARERGARAVLVTSDRDAFALIDEHTGVLRIINGGVDASPLLTPDRLMLLLGVRPDQYRDYAALRGDPSDNLPGVPGVGPKTAARLLARFGTAAAAFADLTTVEAEFGRGLARRLTDPGAHAAWQLNRAVMAQVDGLELAVDLAGGPGCLPLSADGVAEVFAAHRLTWSAAQAARVLADTEIEVQRPPRPAPAWNPNWTGRRTGRPRVAAPAKPASMQLSLFDAV